MFLYPVAHNNRPLCVRVMCGMESPGGLHENHTRRRCKEVRSRGRSGERASLLLSKQGFSGPGDIRVSVSGQINDSRYVVKIDLDAAKVVAQVLGHPPQLDISNCMPVTWEFD